jgi:excinuclease UvrABC ATPase subunit
MQYYPESAILVRTQQRRSNHVFSEELITLDCPYCQAAISRPLTWFKQTYTNCPACDGGLAAGQFAPLIKELEQAIDASVDEMVLGKSSTECAGGGCGGGSCSH